MTEGISKERLLFWNGLNTTDLTSYELLEILLIECSELDPWLPIKDAPKDKCILVYAPAYQDLPPLQQVCRWHESAGFCIDELRTTTHYKLLPEDPK